MNAMFGIVYMLVSIVGAGIIGLVVYILLLVVKALRIYLAKNRRNDFN